MEAMALAKPVVATNVLGTNELVVDGETGYLVPLDDQAALVERVKTLCADPGLRNRMGGAGRRRVTERFDERRIVELWSSVYSKQYQHRSALAKDGMFVL